MTSIVLFFGRVIIFSRAVALRKIIKRRMVKTLFDKQYLRNAMLAECLSIRQLSLKSKVAYATVWLILNDQKKEPSLRTVGKLAKALNRNPADFFKE